MTTPRRRIVVTDANVLINLIHVVRWDLCAQLPGIEFVVPDHVRDEVTDRAQRSALDRAVAKGSLRIVSIADLADIASFGDLTIHLGRGEAACLVLAARNGWSIASDEKGRFRREALARIGKARIIGTAAIYILALNAGLLTIEQADSDKAILEETCFRMPFRSFREILMTADAEEPLR